LAGFEPHPTPDKVGPWKNRANILDFYSDLSALIETKKDQDDWKNAYFIPWHRQFHKNRCG
jgi:hypothetical protein